MLKINNLVKNYPDFRLRCSLEVAPGCITGLIGKNGSGKSTTFKAVLGLIRADEGSVEIFGKNYQDISKKDKQKLGVVLSDSGFSVYLTVKNIIKIMQTMYDDFEPEYFLSYCHKFKLPLDKKIKDFSTGMKAKIKLLVAMSHQAELLILDEPTLGLDVVARDALLDMLRDYMEKDDKRSILISSHISSDLEQLCDDFYMIDDGNIILHEETDVLLSDYAVLKMDRERFASLDKRYLMKYQEETYGYRCLTSQKAFYLENYPKLVVEKGNIDELITIMIGGKEV